LRPDGTNVNGFVNFAREVPDGPFPTAEIGIGALVALTSPDEVAELHLAGGSGFGDPLQRSIEAVQRDLDGGYVTPQGARDYGCVAGPDGLIDPGASREPESGLRGREATEG
jgi:5-oxoprolinase (ATP-hydrolysing)